MKPLLVTSLLGLILYTASPLHAQIYSYTDANGQRVFSDQPPPEGAAHSTLELKPTNRMPATPRLVKLKPPPQVAQQLAPPPPPYQSLTLLQPAPDSTLRNTSRSIDIQVSSTPSLLPGHSYQAWLDGSAHGPASTTDSWRIEEIDRGEHQLLIHLLDEQGNTLLQTEAAAVHIRQTTLADRKRINPCQDADYGKRPECPLAEKPEKTKPWWRMGF
ncbi:MAG: DUF4124 domain-containing protein [Thiopseudomonas sp.]|nr:DUF4124 domain-containing protein [Thiopseudomonas sp.]